MNAIDLVDSIITKGSNADEILSNKENVLIIFNNFESIQIEKLGQILFVLINKLQEYINDYDYDEIFLIYTKLISKNDLFSNQSFSFLISNFIQFLILCFYIPLDSVIEFTNNILNQTFGESAEKIEIINENTKIFSVLIITNLIKSLSMIGQNDLILRYRNLLFLLLSHILEQNDSNFPKIVCEAIVEIIENSFDSLIDTFEYFQQIITLIRQFGNFLIWDMMWHSLSFADEDLIKNILDFTINLFYELKEDEFNKSIYNFIANNIEYVDFQKYINEDDDISLLTLLLQHIISLDSLYDYDDSLFCKIVKYASLNEKEFQTLLQFIIETVHSDSLSELQIITCFSAFSELLEEQGYKFLSFSFEEDLNEQEEESFEEQNSNNLLLFDPITNISQELQNEAQKYSQQDHFKIYPKENFWINLIFSFLVENKEDILSDPFLISSVDCLIQNFNDYKEFINSNAKTDLFSFCFSSLNEIDDETHFSAFYKLLTDLIPLCNCLQLDDLIPNINERNIEVLIEFLKYFDYNLSNEKTAEIIQTFLPLTELNDDSALCFYKLISVLYIQKPYFDQSSQIFSEFTQTILNSLPQQEPNFIYQFLETMIETLCSIHTLPEFDLSPIDGLFSDEQTDVVKPIRENIKKLQFLYAHANSTTLEECNTKRYLLFKENPLLYLKIIISFPEFFSPAFMINCNETWACYSYLVDKRQLETVSSFFRSIIENGNDYCIKFAFNFFIQIPLNSNCHYIRSALILFPTLLNCQSLPQEQLHKILAIFSENAYFYIHFALNQNLILNLINIEEYIFNNSLVVSGSSCANLTFNENFQEIVTELLKQPNFIQIILQNYSNNGFDVFLLAIYSSFPFLLSDENPLKRQHLEIILNIIQSFPQKKYFCEQIFIYLMKLLENDQIENIIKIDICKSLMKYLLKSDFAIHSRHLSRERIISVLKQIPDQSIIESSLSNLEEDQEIIISFLQ